MPIGVENLAEKILDGLDNKHKELAWSMQVGETLVMSTKLHGNLLNFETSLQDLSPYLFSFFITKNLVNQNTMRWHPSIANNMLITIFRLPHNCQ